jgi:4-amino-4-deoxy-L-arabinose transferase-like glycosyltransferase
MVRALAHGPWYRIAAPTVNGATLRRVRNLPAPGAEVRAALVRLGLLAVGGLAIASYQAVGRVFYHGYWIPQGSGMYELLPEELTHIALFTSFGLLALAGLAGALAGTSLAASAEALVRRLALHPRTAVCLLSALALFGSAFVGFRVLGSAVVSDDEHTYRFIAQTLRTGSLTAPSPGADLPFFREQFVVLDEQVRYGKYPVAHPVLLAVGQALGAEGWVVPVLTGAIVALTYAMAAPRFGTVVALVAAALTASSPQVLLTGGTYLSQPASAACLLAGAALFGSGPTSLGRLAAAGAAFGLGIAVRPLPGVLFAAVAGMFVAARAWDAGPKRAAAALGAFGLPVAAGAGLILLQNRLQSGDAMTSGYQTFHATGAGSGGLAVFLFGGDLGLVAMSVVGSLMRLDGWAFGWPLAPLLAAGAWRAPRTALLWSLAGAGLAYRIVSPKVGVGATGPVYLFEIVPLLAVLVAVGAARLARRLEARRAVSSLLVAGAIVGLSMFLPARLAALRTMGLAQRLPHLMLAERGIHHAVVFQQAVVPWWTRLSWSYYPRHNSPRLDDDVLFLHLDAPESLPAAAEMSRRRFPDRTAWYFQYAPRTGPVLVPIGVALAHPPADAGSAPDPHAP